MVFIYQQEYNRNVSALKDRPLQEIATDLSAMISALINHFDDLFTRWTLITAPVQIVHPHPRYSGIKTMAAAEDGKIYINPAFWNTAYSYAVGSNSEINAPQDLGFLLFHEICHHLFQHHRYHSFILQDALNRNIPVTVARSIANTSMDYIINAICAELFPRAIIFKYPSEGFASITRQNLLPTLEDLGVKTQFIAQRILSKNPAEWEWAEIYAMAVSAWDPVQAKKKKPAPHQEDTDRQDYELTNHPGGDTNGHEKNLIRDAHGDHINIAGAVEARAGSLPEMEDPVESWPKSCRVLLLDQRRQSGNQAGKALRILEQIEETRIPWTQAMYNLVHYATRTDEVIASWRTPARKNPLYPGRTFMETGNIWFLIDTSASISDEELGCLMGAASYAAHMRVEHQGLVIVIPWDVITYDDFIWEKGHHHAGLKTLPGGGGTLLKPALEKVLSDTRFRFSDLVVVCTDSCIHDAGEIAPYLYALYHQSGNKVLWFNIGRETDAAYLNDIHVVLRINRADYQHLI